MIRRWMPILVLLGLVIVAARPLWALSFFDSYDGPSHLYRLFALDDTLRQGIVYPRWLLPLAYGMGYPIYNFYPPFAGYVAETIHLLGLDFVQALKTAFLLCLALGACGAYLLGAELYRGFPQTRLAALLTATAYIFFPYWMIGVYTRGAIAEVMALAVIPWLFWALRRALGSQKVSAYLLLAILLAILTTTHSLTTVILSPLLVIFTLVSLWQRSRRAQVVALACAAGAVLLALGLGAFYWLPFVTELRLVQMGQGYDRIIQVFETNFFKPVNVVQPLLLYEYGGPPTPLGLVGMAFALCSVVTALLARQFRERGLVVTFGVVLLVATLLMTEPARQLWLQVSLASLIQSVWRVTSLITLCVAVVIGALPVMLPTLGPLARSPGTLQRGAVLVTGISILIVVSAVARLAPVELRLPQDATSLSHLARFEVNDGNLGTTTFGEYLPLTATAPDLIAYRAPPSPVTHSPQVQIVQQRGADWTLDVNGAAPTRLTLRILNFPDRAVRVDGIPVPTQTASDLGLLVFDVPYGAHRVDITTRATFPEQLGSSLTLIAVLASLGFLAFAFYRRERQAWLPAVAIGLGLVVFVPPNSLALASSPAPVVPLNENVNPDVKLVGATIEGAQWNSEAWIVTNARRALGVRAYWHVLKSGQSAAPIHWRLVDASGTVRSERAQLPNFGTAPQSSWLTNELLMDQAELPIPASLPRGQYQLQIGYGASASFVTVGRVHLQSDAPAESATATPLHNVQGQFGNHIQFLGYDAPATACPGDSLSVSLYWRATDDILEDYRGSLQLLDAAGKLVAQSDGITGQGLEPTSLWIPGQSVVENRELNLPRALPPGAYQLITVLYRLPDAKRLPVTTANGPAPDRALVLGQVPVDNCAMLFP